eukprot:CAMPEP_0201894616 /NCGR_PEP_ID=MMETSP0902-20130614/41062_1 /ASSEMBLY_ACC=CAM_ASM_000551 /TAXON_ID=420261 /ORGANISM="Thalassiosira antarctica, Strain CCMP982" /LENGTH=71 /DNA_ID=CAMNT_0048426705 /DNA_START=283 /DNA_END=498 /DNA_ORIENTATION=+
MAASARHCRYSPNKDDAATFASTEETSPAASAEHKVAATSDDRQKHANPPTGGNKKDQSLPIHRQQETMQS